ncbi:MAG: 4-(cytidine 5'-diphospho)-2-C-methyl-D-erythritol kinase [Sphingomonadales bacterium]
MVLIIICFVRQKYGFSAIAYLYHMILYPPAKINLGLHILAKRQDAYHEIETIMAQVPLFDILEITEDQQDYFLQTGIIVPPDDKPNLCERAVSLLRSKTNFPKVRIHLRKQIPIGAGLGGGSADASYTLMGLNELFDLGFSVAELASMASQLGSDCPFFIQGGLQLAKGRGEILQKFPSFNRRVQLVLCNPRINVSTAQAYSGVIPNSSRKSIQEICEEKKLDSLQNDFEPSVFKAFPAIAELKEKLRSAGAFYAAMSGSGSSVFALFDLEQDFNLNGIEPQTIIYSGIWDF